MRSSRVASSAEACAPLGGQQRWAVRRLVRKSRAIRAPRRRAHYVRIEPAARTCERRAALSRREA
eukprot:5019823-Prymnesium_polylepis.1